MRNNMKDLKTTNIFLLIIVIPLVFYLLKILSFIFIPMVLAMFLALLFLLLMRWLKNRNVPKPISILIVIIIIVGLLKLGGVLIQIPSNEIIATKGIFFEKAEKKIVDLIEMGAKFFGIKLLQGENAIKHYFHGNTSFEKFGNILCFITDTLSMTLMTVFFVILLLSESINFQNILNNTLFKVRHSSVKTIIRIEKDIIRFVRVKDVLIETNNFNLKIFNSCLQNRK